MEPLTIIDGTHRDDGTPRTRWLGDLYGPNGERVPVYADTIVAAYLAAVGPPPIPPTLVAGGLVPVYGQVVFDDSTPFDEALTTTLRWVYDAGQDSVNAAAAEEYKAAVDGWNNHAAVVRGQIEFLLKQAKGEMK